jgi:hypothetical protein
MLKAITIRLGLIVSVVDALIGSLVALPYVMSFVSEKMATAEGLQRFTYSLYPLLFILVHLGVCSCAITLGIRGWSDKTPAHTKADPKIIPEPKK